MTTQTSPIETPDVVSHEEWVSRRTAFLAKEKEFTRLRDELTKAAQRAAVGGGHQVVCVRGPKWQADAGRAVRG